MEKTKRGHILVVEDDDNIRDLVKLNLEKDGYRVAATANAEKALLLVGGNEFDLFLIDLMLPGLSGIDLIRNLKREDVTKRIPVIIVTARDDEQDVATGLDLGADDYITKPFSIHVLAARVRAVLRRSGESAQKKTKAQESVSIRELSIDTVRHKVMIARKQIDLTITEFEILCHLARNPGRVFTRYQIVEAVRGSDYAVTERSVDVLIFGLRKKLGELEHYIETVRGLGYRFIESEQA